MSTTSKDKLDDGELGDEGIDDELPGDDVPDDFFEDFEKNEFLDGLEVLDDLSPSMHRRRHRSDSELSSESSNFGLVEKQSHVLNEIKKLERDIAERRRKLCRVRSPELRMTSPRHRRRSTSRRRRNARSSSWSRGHRVRSRSRNRRTRSRGRPTRTQNEHQRRYDRSKLNEKNDPRKAISFLEELSQKFAEQGKPFPEGDTFDINAMNNYNMPPNNFNNAMGQYPMYNPMMGPQQQQWMNYNNPTHMMGPGPPGISPGSGMPMFDPMQQNMMRQMDFPQVSMDLDSSNSNDKIPTPPPPAIVKYEYEEPNSQYCDTDEMIRKTFKESVLARCRDVINLLKASQERPNKPPKLQYVPTVISANLPANTFLSPFQTIHNVDFDFDDDDKMPSYLKSLSKSTSNIVNSIGFNMKAVNFQKPDESHDEPPKLPNEALPVNLKFNIGTQTMPQQCQRCLQNDLREFKDKSTQVAAVTYHIGCQTTNEDPYSFAEMTPAQVIAVNDFGKIIKNSLMPTNYREATDLRDRLFNIYQACTGLNRNAFMRDNENQINPAIFRDINEREPIRDSRMAQNDMRSDRGGNQTFSRQPDAFQSNNQFNMSTNTQDRFMQNNRFDSNMQHDNLNSMRNSDPRNMQPNQQQTDFGSNRMSDLSNMSSNRFDTLQDRFPSLNTLSMNQQRQPNMWENAQGAGGGGGGGTLSSLSSPGNMRNTLNDDFARRPIPQPLFPETSSGVMTCKQIMEMERGLSNRGNQSHQQTNNMQFDNIKNMQRNTGGGGGRGGGGSVGGGGGGRGGGGGVGGSGGGGGGVGGGSRGNRGGGQNRNQQQNRQF